MTFFNVLNSVWGWHERRYSYQLRRVWYTGMLAIEFILHSLVILTHHSVKGGYRQTGHGDSFGVSLSCCPLSGYHQPSPPVKTHEAYCNTLMPLGRKCLDFLVLRVLPVTRIPARLRLLAEGVGMIALTSLFAVFVPQVQIVFGLVNYPPPSTSILLFIFILTLHL